MSVIDALHGDTNSQLISVLTVGCGPRTLPGGVGGRIPDGRLEGEPRAAIGLSAARRPFVLRWRIVPRLGT